LLVLLNALWRKIDRIGNGFLQDLFLLFKPDMTVDRVTTCLENLEISGNLKHVREMSGIMSTVKEKSGKKYCRGKVSFP